MMKAMILAAGLGQRMRPLTDHLPKPLLRAGDKPLLDYHLENIARAGIREVIINLAYLGDKIRAHVGDGSRFGLQVNYSQEPEPLETGGALFHALPLLGDAPFLLVNGDVWCDLPFQTFIQHPWEAQDAAHLLLVPNPSFHPQGDFTLGSDGRVLPQCATPEPHIASQRFTFAGISLIHPRLISSYPDKRQKFPLVEAFRYAIQQHTLTASLHTGHWSDVGTPERLHDLNNYLQYASNRQRV